MWIAVRFGGAEIIVKTNLLAGNLISQTRMRLACYCTFSLKKDMLRLDMVGLVLLAGERLFDGRTQIP
jgi:hypothetical protein